MSAQVYDIAVDQGARFTMRLRYVTDAGSPAVDLDEYSARMQMRPGYRSDELWASVTQADGDITVDAQTGEINVFIGASVTEQIPAPARGVYDLELENDTNPEDVIRLVMGKVYVRPEVTRPVVTP